jgi:hypothetical protein
MLPIDYHVQHALYNFNRDMKCLKHGSKGPSPAGQRSKGGSDRERPGMVSRLSRAVVHCLGNPRSGPDKPWRSDLAPSQRSKKILLSGHHRSPQALAHLGLGSVIPAPACDQSIPTA